MSLAATSRHQRSPVSRTLQVLSLIRKVDTAFDPFNLAELLSDALEPLGAGVATYLHLIPEPNDLQRLEQHLACTPVLAYDLSEHARPEFKRWLDYGRDHTEPLVVSADLPAGQLSTVADAWRREFRSTLLVPTHSGGAVGRFGLLVLGCRTRGHFDHPSRHSDKLLAQTLATVMHAWWVNTTRRELLKSTGLNAGDLKLLSMERRGMVTKQIAKLMNTSPKAIDQRFLRINHWMGTKYRHEAALRAAIYDLL